MDGSRESVASAKNMSDVNVYFESDENFRDKK